MEDRTLLSPGALDPTFGNAGIANVPFIRGSNSAAVLVQPDGKVLLAATVGMLAQVTIFDFGLARLNADGTLDTTFGTGGEVLTTFAGPATVTDAVLTRDGKIVVVGTADNGPLCCPEFALARYNGDGTLDTGFGMGGKVLTSFGTAFNSSISDVVVQADGKIVVLGSATSSPSRVFFALVRYNPDGSLDTSFGTGGVSATDFGDSLALQTDGRLVVAANDRVARYTASGSLDVTFGTGGVASTGLQVPSSNLDVTQQPDGKILLAGAAPTGGSRIALVRFNLNGALDATFGTGGVVVFPNSTDPLHGWVSHEVGVASDGRILVGGAELSNPTLVSLGPAVIRFDPNGNVDNAFAGGIIAGFSPGVVLGLAFQADGKILVAGTNSIMPFTTIAVVGRLLTDDPLPTASQRFVAQAYLDLLQRTAEPGGLSYWSGVLDQGQATRDQVASGIEASPEYRAIEVQGMFGLLLNRAPTSDEVNAYGSFLATGGTVEQAEAAVTGSAEYAHNHGGTNDGFLDGLFRDAFGRAVDPAARNALDQVLATGVMTRQQVGAVIFGSVEYFADLVQGFYHRFLHRPADPIGLADAVNALTNGLLADEAIIAAQVGSDEYAAVRT
jgi:uncharacterized delta-60 repeat protein